MALAAISLILPPLAIALSWFAWSDALPARIASHWSGLGYADDSLPTQGVFLFAIITTSIAALAGLVVLVLPQISKRMNRATAFWLGMASGLAMTVWLIPAWLTYQAGSAEGAVLGAWIIPMMASALYGVIPYALIPRVVLEVNAGAGRLPLAPTEVGAWSRTITSSVFVWTFVLMLVIGVVAFGGAIIAGYLQDALLGLVVFGLAILLVALLVRLRVTIDWRGFRLVSSFFGIPLKRIPLKDIQTVETATLRPSEWGGWGYRMMPGRSALILRNGPGMIITTTSQKQFAVTLTDPGTPAALLATLADGAAPEAAVASNQG
jgi:hypothetical protein